MFGNVRHGYGKWQAIAEDKHLGIQDAICQHLFIPVPGTFQPQSTGVGTSQAQFHNPGTGQAQASTDTAARAQFAQDQSLFNYRDVQRRLSEFIKKRVLLLEKGLNCEMAKIFLVSPSGFSNIL